MNNTLKTCVAPLFVPATRPDRFAKAMKSGADAIIIDFEDSVAANEKVAVRDLIAKAHLPEGAFLFRVNAVSTPWFKDDVGAVTKLGQRGVLLPKVENVDDVRAVRSIDSSLDIVALIETAKGLANARAIAASGPLRLAFGSLDYCVDLGCAHEREALLAARSELVLASRLASIAPPLDGVTVDTKDSAAVKSDAGYAAALGFSGKLCIHPTQIAAVKLAFAPSAQEIAWAERIGVASHKGVTVVDGMMVDAPVRLRAQAILARAAKL